MIFLTLVVGASSMATPETESLSLMPRYMPHTFPDVSPLKDETFHDASKWARAPSINAGDILKISDVINAEEEASMRQKLCLPFSGSTVSEVADANVRLHTVRQEWSKVVYPYEVTPCTGSEHLSNLFHSLHHKIDAAKDRLQAAEDRRQCATAAEAAAAAAQVAAAVALGAVAAAAADRQQTDADRQQADADRQQATADRQQATADRQKATADRQQAAIDRRRFSRSERILTARLENQIVRARNRQALMDSANGNQALRPLFKERRGVGPPLRRAPVLQPPVRVRLGTPVGAPFPSTVQHLYRLTRRQLSELAMMFNDDFGINDGDALSVQRVKFLKFIIGS